MSLTRRDHDLVLFRSDAKKSEIVLRVDVTHNTSSLGGELMQQTGILDSGRVVHGRLDRYALGVDHDEADDAFVRRYSLYCLFYFGLQ